MSRRNVGYGGGSITIDLSAIFVVVGLALLGLLAWATAPLFHGLWYTLIWHNLTAWIICAVIIFLWMLLVTLFDSDFMTTVLTVAGFFLMIFAMVYIGADTKAKMAQAVTYKEIDQMPNTEELRYLPFEVATEYAAKKYQSSVDHLGDMDPVDSGAGIDWFGPRVPTGIIRQLGEKPSGIAVVNRDGSVTLQNYPMACGEGIFFTDNIRWKLWRRHYTAELPEIYYLTVDDELLALVPYIRHKYLFPSRVPYWAGVFVVHVDDCKIEDLTPQQAVTDSRFTGQRLVPELYAKKLGQAWGYRLGVGNAWLSHVDQTQMAHIDNSENQMPYFLPSSGEPYWFNALDPYGQAQGVYKAMFINAYTGEVLIHTLQNNTIGPNTALEAVQTARPAYIWAGTDEGTAKLIEPRPLVRDNHLYWMATLTSRANFGVKSTFVVDAQNDQVVYEFENYQQVVGFLKSGEVVDLSGVEQAGGVEGPSENIELSSFSKEELIDLLRRIADELDSRVENSILGPAFKWLIK